MLSRASHLTNKAVPKLNNSGLIITRGMHWEAKNPLSLDKTHIDPKARVNNDAQHIEIVKNQCPKPNCAEKRCPKVCEEPAQASSEGHFTHNGSYQVKGKTTHHLGNEDFNGNLKAQFAVKYQDAHKTDPFQTANKKATTYIQKDSALESFLKADDSDSKKTNNE